MQKKGGSSRRPAEDNQLITSRQSSEDESTGNERRLPECYLMVGD